MWRAGASSATCLVLFFYFMGMVKCQGKYSNYIGSMFYFNLFKLVVCGIHLKKHNLYTPVVTVMRLQLDSERG